MGMVHWIKHPASSPRTMRDTLIYTVSALLIELCHRPGSTPKPLFSTKQLNRFESTEIPGKLVAGRLDPAPSPRPLSRVANFHTHVSTPETLMPDGRKIWVL